MIIKKGFLLIIALFCSAQLIAQSKKELAKEKKSLLAYKRIYAYSDSISKIQSPGLLQKDVFRIADSLNRFHPLSYFQKVVELLAQSKYNEASFIYFLGSFRYSYYNYTNPDYKESSDGALFSSLSVVTGEVVGMYLRSNVDNFIAIVKQSADWNAKNDYKFLSKDKNPQKYQEMLDGLTKTVTDLEKNKEEFQEQYKKERENNLKRFDDALKRIDKH